MTARGGARPGNGLVLLQCFQPGDFQNSRPAWERAEKDTHPRKTLSTGRGSRVQGRHAVPAACRLVCVYCPRSPLLSCYCFLQAVPGAGLPLLVRCAKSLLLCPSLCDPMDSRLPGSSVHGVFQARILEWVAIAFSREIFLTRGSSLRLLHWHAGSLPLGPPGSLCLDRGSF